jgi:hypothetical protein
MEPEKSQLNPNIPYTQMDVDNPTSKKQFMITFNAFYLEPPPLIRNDIQGLRGIAIIFVLLYHFWPAEFQAGYLGVDV